MDISYQRKDKLQVNVFIYQHVTLKEINLIAYNIVT